VSKTTAKKTPKAKPAARKTAHPAKASKPSAKAARPATKSSARPATKGLAKPARKVAHPVSKSPAKAAKPTPKPKPKAAAKPASKAVPSRSPVKPAVKSSAKIPLKASPHPVKATAMAPEPAPKPTAKAVAPKTSAPKPGKTPTVMPTSPPSTLTSSRFADRFAPPKPPTRQMNNLDIDIVKAPHKADPKLANAWKSKAGRELTEAELLSMPENAYMNEKQLDFFRARLQSLKDDLLSNAGETTEHLREDTSIVPDPADRATIEEEHALELRTRDRERKLLKKISQSLSRIESGEYGFCDETGEPIGLGRLIARPTATLSLEAQQRRELKQKMFGD
jgi:DnaK suppressor protein